MGYYDPPEENEFLGCPVCQSPSETVWVDIEENDSMFQNCEEPYKCSCCGVYFDFAMKHFDKFINVLAEPEPNYDPPVDLTTEDEATLQEAREASELARMFELGYMSLEGRLTDSFYKEADFQADCYREQKFK